MEYIQGLEGLYINDETAVTLGKFDGLHRGHQKLIRRTREFARQGLKSVVFTLDFNRKGMLLTREERRAMLEKQGVDYLVECPFLPEVAHMEPEEFIRGILAEKLHAREVIVGADFHFGYERKGDAHLLMELQKIYGYEAEIIKKETTTAGRSAALISGKPWKKARWSWQKTFSAIRILSPAKCFTEDIWAGGSFFPRRISSRRRENFCLRTASTFPEPIWRMEGS